MNKFSLKIPYDYHIFEEEYTFLIDELDKSIKDRLRSEYNNDDELKDNFDFDNLCLEFTNETICNSDNLFRSLKSKYPNNKTLSLIYKGIKDLYFKKRMLTKLNESTNYYNELDLFNKLEYEELVESFINSKLEFIDDKLYLVYYFNLDDSANKWLDKQEDKNIFVFY